MAGESLIRIPDMNEIMRMLKEEAIYPAILVTADELYFKLNENESYYNTITKNLGKWGKPIVEGLIGLGLYLINNKHTRRLGALQIGMSIGEAIKRGLIRPQYVIVEKTDNGLKFKLEGFDANNTFKIFLNGTEVASGTTDANGSAEVTVTGTVEIKATEIAVVCGSTTFSNRIPYSVTPTA